MQPEKTIEQMFLEAFPAFSYPFEGATRKVEEMEPPEQQLYYEQARSIVKNVVWQNELASLKNSLIGDAVLRGDSEFRFSRVDAYRLVLIALQDLEKRLGTLAGLTNTPVSHEQIKNI